MCMVAVTRLSLLDNDADLNWVQLFSSSLYYFGLRLCDESQCCLCKYYNACVSTETPIFCFIALSRILAQVTRIVDSIVIEQVEYCIATSISCLTRSKIEDFYGNVKWKLEESFRMTLWEAKMHGKETFSLAYNLI